MNSKIKNKNDFLIEANTARNLSSILKHYLRKRNFSDDQQQMQIGSSILQYCRVGGKQNTYDKWIWNLYSHLDYLGDYSCNPEKYEIAIQEAINKIKKYIYDDISYFGDKNKNTALQELIENIEWAKGKDFSEKENRYFCSSQLWAFLPEVDKSQYPDFYKFIEEKAEELDKDPWPQKNPSYNDEIESYKDKLEYLLGYLKLIINR